MKVKFALPVLAISVVAAIAFSIQWTHQRWQVHHVVIATGSLDGEYYAFAKALVV